MTRRALVALSSIGALLSALVVTTANPASALEAGDTIVVDTTTDAADAAAGDGTCATAAGECSLRAALQEAQALHEDDVTTVIQVPAGEYVLTEGQLYAYKVNVVIRGAGVGETIVRAADVEDGGRHLAMAMDGQLVVTLEDMTFTDGGGRYEGGSILNNGGTLTVRRMHFVDNESFGHGGAIASYGDQLIRTLVVEDSTFAGNRTGQLGGAIHADAEENVTVTNSTFTDNSAAYGGAIAAGGLAGGATVEILHATFAGNAASGTQGDAEGGALFAGDGGEITLTSSIVESSVESERVFAPVAVGDPIANCASVEDGTITSGGWNVVDDASCSTEEDTDKPDTAAGVRPLADNGGPTFTMALDIGSPAVDAAGATCELTADQRGVARPQDGNGDGVVACDSGAYEAQTVVEDPVPPTTAPVTPEAPTPQPPAARPVQQTPSYTG